MMKSRESLLLATLLLCLPMVACSKPVMPAAAAEPSAPQTQTSDPEDRQALLEGYLRAAEAADAIEDNERRCLAYPNLPWMRWDDKVVKARCALTRAPALSLADVETLLEQKNGAKTLETHFRQQLKAHYSDPDQRDQIFNAFFIFEGAGRPRQAAYRWLAKAPKSPFALFAVGHNNAGLAQDSRGEDSYQDTSQARLDMMRAYAEDAITHLQRAWQAAPELTPACAGLMEMATMTGLDDVQEYVTAPCLKQDPTSYYLVSQWKRSQEPRWGGSPEGLDAVRAHIDQYVGTNPALACVSASVEGDAYLGMTRGLPNHIDGIEQASGIAPVSSLMNVLSAAHRENDDLRLSIAYLSQAIRFEIGTSPFYRDLRALFTASTTIKNPHWSALDRLAILRNDPNSMHARFAYNQVLHWITEKTELAPVETFEGADSTITFSIESATFDSCEQTAFQSPPSLALQKCADELVQKWPTNPFAWRLRAEVLNAIGGAGVAEAAQKYLALANPGDIAYAINKARFERMAQQKAKD